jgi:hypothetical protein
METHENKKNYLETLNVIILRAPNEFQIHDVKSSKYLR